MKKHIICIITLLYIAGCKKEITAPLTECTDNRSTSSSAKINVNNGRVEYTIKTEYANNYVHWCQLQASPLTTYEKQNACGPTAYMLAAHMVATAEGYTFMPVSGTKLKNIISAMGSVPIGMTQIATHITAHDSPPLTSISCTTSDRSAFRTFMESNLSDGNPIIVPIFINDSKVNDVRYSSTASDNFDIDSSPQSGRPNYILTTKINGGYGHFVVVIGISMSSTTGSNGLVYYKDPLANSGATKICSYTRFLESAKANGGCKEPNCINYDALVIKKQ